MGKIRQQLQRAHDDGWLSSRTPGGHIKLMHPAAAGPVFASSSPSDRRTEQNLQAQLRRALPSVTASAEPAVRTPANAVKARPAARPKTEPVYFTSLPQYRSPPRRAVDDAPNLRPVIPSREAVFAWAVASMRLRQKGIEWSTLRVLRARYRRDFDYHAAILTAYQQIPRAEIARLRAACRAGRIVPPAGTPIDISPFIPCKAVAMSETASIDVHPASPTLNELTAALETERSNRSKAMRELADLRARSYAVQTVSAELEQQKAMVTGLEHDLQTASAELNRVQSAQEVQDAAITERLDRIETTLQHVIACLAARPVPATLANPVDAAVPPVTQATTQATTPVPPEQWGKPGGSQPRADKPGSKPATAGRRGSAQPYRGPYRPTSAAPAPASRKPATDRAAPAAPVINHATIGLRIRAARQVCGLSQIDLGDMLNVSGTTVSFWERGKSPVRPEILRTLAKHLNVTEGYLRGG